MSGEEQSVRYADVIATALSIADRADDLELPLVIDRFLRLVEARVNRILQTRNQTRRATLVTEKEVSYYSLPADFAGMRHIEIKTTRDAPYGIPVSFLAPEALTRYCQANGNDPSFTIIGNSLHLWPPMQYQFIEITYYQRILPLSNDNPENWLSDQHPDAYIQGLLVEISSFTKDAEAASLWNERFTKTADEIILEDAIDNWSGPAPTVRLA